MIKNFSSGGYTDMKMLEAAKKIGGYETQKSQGSGEGELGIHVAFVSRTIHTPSYHIIEIQNIINKKYWEEWKHLPNARVEDLDGLLRGEDGCEITVISSDETGITASFITKVYFAYEKNDSTGKMDFCKEPNIGGWYQPLPYKD